MTGCKGGYQKVILTTSLMLVNLLMCENIGAGMENAEDC